MLHQNIKILKDWCNRRKKKLALMKLILYRRTPLNRLNYTNLLKSKILKKKKKKKKKKKQVYSIKCQKYFIKRTQ